MTFQKGYDPYRKAFTFEERTRGMEGYVKRRNEEMTTFPFEKLGRLQRRKRVLNEQEHRCFVCRLNEWQGKPLILEFDHIDGIKKNETRKNLRYLCPNCHSQTPTWRRKKSSLSKDTILGD